MKELEIAINQLKRAMRNLDKADDNFWADGQHIKAEKAEEIALEIASIIDKTRTLNW